MIRTFVVLFILYAAVSSADFAIAVAEQEVVACDTDMECMEKNPTKGEY